MFCCHFHLAVLLAGAFRCCFHRDKCVAHLVGRNVTVEDGERARCYEDMEFFHIVCEKAKFYALLWLVRRFDYENLVRVKIDGALF